MDNVGPTACADRHRQDRGREPRPFHYRRRKWTNRTTPRNISLRRYSALCWPATRPRAALAAPTKKRPAAQRHSVTGSTRPHGPRDRGRADSLRRSPPAGRATTCKQVAASAPGPQEAGGPARASPAAQGRTGRRPRPGRQLAQIATGRTASGPRPESRSQFSAPAPKRPGTDRLERHRQHKAARAETEAGPTACADRPAGRLEATTGRSHFRPGPQDGDRPGRASPEAGPRQPGRQLADRRRQDCLGHDLKAGRPPPPPAPKRPGTDRLERHRQHKAARARPRPGRQLAADRHRQDRSGHDMKAGRSFRPRPQEAGDRPARDAPAAQGRTGRRPRPGRQLAQIATGRTGGHDLQAGRSFRPRSPRGRGQTG